MTMMYIQCILYYIIIVVAFCVQCDYLWLAILQSFTSTQVHPLGCSKGLREKLFMARRIPYFTTDPVESFDARIN